MHAPEIGERARPRIAFATAKRKDSGVKCSCCYYDVVGDDVDALVTYFYALFAEYTHVHVLHISVCMHVCNCESFCLQCRHFLSLPHLCGICGITGISYSSNCSIAEKCIINAAAELKLSARCCRTSAVCRLPSAVESVPGW